VGHILSGCDGFSELRFDGFFKGILGSMGLGEYVNLMKIYMFPLSVNLQVRAPPL
jgi:hypothetical protein